MIRQETAFQEGHKYLSEYQDISYNFLKVPLQKRRKRRRRGRGSGEREKEKKKGKKKKKGTKEKNWLSHQPLDRHKPLHPLENPILMVRWLANDLSQVSKNKPG